MISAVCWVRKGASKIVPEAAEPPTQEEIDEILGSVGLERRGSDEEEEEEEEDQEMDVDDAPKEVDEVAHALAAAHCLGKVQGDKSSSDLQGIVDTLQELDMDHYDDEDDGIEIFSSGRGDTYYPGNEVDPYLQGGNNDDDEEEIDDMTIKPTDAVIVCARNDDEVSALEVSIFEELEGESNMYVHHDVILPDFPLCIAWLDCNLKNGDKGNFIAVGSMEPAIEIWDLDLLDEVQPFMVLGGVSKKKKKMKTGKKSSIKFQKGSHKDSVLGLAWNKEVRNVLASASADKSVKVWDVVTRKCVVTMEHHTDKVQAVAWSQHAPEVLLSGSFDRTIAMMDMRCNASVGNTWPVAADVESVAWNPHKEHSFLVSLYNGTVQSFDARTSNADSDSGCKALFTIHAHDKAVTSIDYHPSAPNLIATGSEDKMVKLWDLSNNQPSCVASRNPKAGAVFSLSFSEDSPFLLAIGGSKGKLRVWDTLTDPGIARSFGKFSKKSVNNPGS